MNTIEDIKKEHQWLSINFDSEIVTPYKNYPHDLKEIMKRLKQNHVIIPINRK